MPFAGQALPGPGVDLGGTAAILGVVDPPAGDMDLVLGVTLPAGREENRLTDAGRAVQRDVVVTRRIRAGQGRAAYAA